MAALLLQLPTFKNIARHLPDVHWGWMVDYTSLLGNNIHKAAVTVKQIDLY